MNADLRTDLRIAFALLAVLAGCGEDRRIEDADASAPTTDAQAPMGNDAGGAPDDAGAPEPDGGPIPDDAGSLGGRITRSAEPRAGGVGHLYVALFDADPVSARDSARMVANTLVENADMRSSDVSVPYEVRGIPPRAEAYYVVAFLDDNGTVDMSDPSRAGPDRGDLVSLEGFGSPRVVVSAPERVSLDLDLNFNLPF